MNNVYEKFNFVADMQCHELLVGEGECEVLEKALNRLSNRVQQRRVLTKPCFQDFDKFSQLYTCTCTCIFHNSTLFPRLSH